MHKNHDKGNVVWLMPGVPGHERHINAAFDSGNLTGLFLGRMT